MLIIISDKANINNTSKNVERVITISVFSENLSTVYQIFPVEFSLKKKKRFYTKNDELINASATEQSYSLWLPLVSFVVDGK